MMKKTGGLPFWTLAALAILIASQGHAAMGERAYEQESMELVWRSIFMDVMRFTVNELKAFHAGFEDFLLFNPPTDEAHIAAFTRSVIVMLQPLYNLAILATGLYLIFFSGSPGGRAKAKRIMPLLFASMVVISVSSDIMRLMFNTSQGITQEIMAKDPSAKGIFLDSMDALMFLFSGGAIVSFDGGHIFPMLIFLQVFSLFTLISIRYLILLSLTLVFPISIFLYTLGFTRAIGRALLEQTVIWTFMQVFMALVVLVSSMGFSVLDLTGDLKVVAAFTTLAVLTSIPLMSLFIRRFLP
ncbi:MAG: hypothetical protein JW724_02765 [Candidatus Altiarchaeota archaeon]|nr:hypothetical protein [Candidatus Altiarchaeota archaeon]